MNVAILVPSLSIGGAERAAQTIGNYLIEKGYTVYYFSNCARGNKYEVKGKVVDVGPDVLATESIVGILKSAKYIKLLKKKYSIDVTVSFMELCNFVNVLSKFNDKIIVSVRTTLSARPELTGVVYNKKLINYLYNKADVVVPVSEYVGEDLINHYGINRKKIKVISNPAIKHDTGQCIEWNYGEYAVICVSRLDYVKQLDRIIRAFKYVVSKISDSKLLILGEGPQEKYLKKISQKFGIEENVVFLGCVDNIGSFLEKSKIFVMASFAEGFPNAMVEAMAYGLPVVTTNSPGGCGEIVGVKAKNNKEIEYCEYGIVTPYISGKPFFSSEIEENELLLGEAILEVLYDENRYNDYKKKSILRAQYYDYEKIMSMWEDILNE